MSSRQPIASPPKHSAWIAFAIYVALSMLFFGRGLIGHLSDRYIGSGADAGAYIWFLDWLHYALTHHLNLFLPSVIWAPRGVNLARFAFAPLAGLLAFPITHLWGPVVAYNFLLIACPSLSAWTAFVLCRRVSGVYWPSVVGGYVFGFSPYMFGHLLGQLDLALVFLLPLMVVTVMSRLDESLSQRWFIIALAILIVGQFLCCPELAATGTLFGGIAIVISYWLLPDYRSRFRGLLPLIAIAYVIVAAIVSGYLFYFFTGAIPDFSISVSSLVSANTTNLVIPSAVNIFGSSKICPGIMQGIQHLRSGRVSWSSCDYCCVRVGTL